MQTVESLIRELQKFPPNARCHTYEGERIVKADGTDCYNYVVIERADGTYPGKTLGCIPCEEGEQDDGPAVGGW